MQEIIIAWILFSIAIYLTAALIPGMALKGFGSAMIASFTVGFLNMTIRPILLLLTLPVNILTLGLFTFIVNAIVLRLAASILKGFEIRGWMPAILGAIVLVIVQSLIFWIFGPSPVEAQSPATV